MSQTIKAVTVNVFVGWRMYERRDVLESNFHSQGIYRKLLNKVQSTVQFILDISQELLSHAATLASSDGRNTDEGEIDSAVPAEVYSGSISKEEIKHLVLNANNRKNKRLSFFNSTDGCTLRMAVQGHEPLLYKSLYCSLCGQHQGTRRGHRSSYKCTLYGVNVCLRVYPGLRKTFWGL